MALESDRYRLRYAARSLNKLITINFPRVNFSIYNFAMIVNLGPGLQTFLESKAILTFRCGISRSCLISIIIVKKVKSKRTHVRYTQSNKLNKLLEAALIIVILGLGKKCPNKLW